jgi:hypothetical protein
LISFRYHVVTILAVFLALAAGVALGGGPLSELGRGDDAAREAAARNAELERQLSAGEDARAFQDEVTAQLGGPALSGSLDGRAVTLVAAPGAEQDQVDALSRLVERAGGTVGGSYALQPALLDLESSSLVDTLGAQLRSSVQDTGVSASATAYERIGGLLGRAVATDTDAGADLDTAADEILGSLEGAELVVPEAQARRGSVVLVVLGDEPKQPEDAEEMYAGVLAGLAGRADALVLTGSTASAESGLLSVLREDPATAGVLSSTDSVQTAAGRIVTVLAAASAAGGKGGHWGALGNDGASPSA